MSTQRSNYPRELHPLLHSKFDRLTPDSQEVVRKALLKSAGSPETLLDAVREEMRQLRLRRSHARLLRCCELLTLALPKARREEVLGDIAEAGHEAQRRQFGRLAVSCLLILKLLMLLRVLSTIRFSELYKRIPNDD